MKKTILLSLFLTTLIFIITGCMNNQKAIEDKTTINNNISEDDTFMKEITITINDNNYNVILEDNETTHSFIKLLPQEFNMSELNGNEKYIYMNIELPTNSSNPKHIEKGDIMLYGNDCLVIFYKSFNTNYSYTKIGHIDNLPDLGNDNINVKFDKK